MFQKKRYLWIWRKLLVISKVGLGPSLTFKCPRLVLRVVFKICIILKLYLHYLCACVKQCNREYGTAETRRGHSISESWSYRMLCAAHYRCWPPNSGPLKEHQVRLTAEPSLWPAGISQWLLTIFLASFKSVLRITIRIVTFCGKTHFLLLKSWRMPAIFLSHHHLKQKDWILEGLGKPGSGATYP